VRIVFIPARSNRRAALPSFSAISLRPIRAFPVSAPTRVPATLQKEALTPAVVHKFIFFIQLVHSCGNYGRFIIPARSLMASRSQVTVCAVLLFLCCPSHAFADNCKLRARRPRHGGTRCVAPASRRSKEFSRAIFARQEHPWFALEHPVVARISLIGTPARKSSSRSPMNWISLNGRNRGEYCSSSPIIFTWTCSRFPNLHGEVAPKCPTAAPAFTRAFLEELVRQAKPASLLERLDKAARLLRDWLGIIVTNAHLARGRDSVTILSSGQQLEPRSCILIRTWTSLSPGEVPSAKFDFPI